MNYTKKAIATILSIVCLLPVLALAEGNLGNAGNNFISAGGNAGYNTNDDLGTSVGTFISIALSLVGLIFLILTVYAGFLWMTSHGEEEPVTKAKKILTNAIIGLVLTVSAYAITYLITSRFGTTPAE